MASPEVARERRQARRLSKQAFGRCYAASRTSRSPATGGRHRRQVTLRYLIYFN
jgi:hypothetical protein